MHTHLYTVYNYHHVLDVQQPIPKFQNDYNPLGNIPEYLAPANLFTMITRTTCSHSRIPVPHLLPDNAHS